MGGIPGAVPLTDCLQERPVPADGAETAKSSAGVNQWMARILEPSIRNTREVSHTRLLR